MYDLEVLHNSTPRDAILLIALFNDNQAGIEIIKFFIFSGRSNFISLLENGEGSQYDAILWQTPESRF